VKERDALASTQRVIKIRWGVKLNEITVYEAEVATAIVYTVTSERSADIRTFGVRPEAENYFDNEVARARGRELP
jgi:hypothetical protein